MNPEILVPEVPEVVYDFFTSEEVTLLWKEFVYEATSTEYGNRTHGNPRTYNAGCHGPRCSRAILELNAAARGGSNSRKSQAKFLMIDAFVLEYQRRKLISDQWILNGQEVRHELEPS